MKKRIYLSTKFYRAYPFKGRNIDMELQGLAYLHASLIEREKYGLATLVLRRMEKLKAIKNNLNQIIPWRYALKIKSWSLN